jgi:hypothetical protein
MGGRKRAAKRIVSAIDEFEDVQMRRIISLFGLAAVVLFAAGNSIAQSAAADAKDTDGQSAPVKATPAGQAVVAPIPQGDSAGTAVLKGGGYCRLGRRLDSIRCEIDNFFTKGVLDSSPRLHSIDGMSPVEYGRGQGSAGASNPAWNAEKGFFNVMVAAGRHTLSVSFHMNAPTPGAVYSSPSRDTPFVATAGHSYVLRALLIGNGNWTPLIFDVTDKKHEQLVVEK